MRRTSQIPSVSFQNDGGQPNGRKPVLKGRSWDGVMAHMNAWENGISPDLKADFEACDYGTKNVAGRNYSPLRCGVGG